MKQSKNGRDRALARLLVRWFEGAARDLPWRTTPRDPYRSLVSEVMLQQTQVSRVVERFGPFVARFPTVGALAAADEGEVLAEWSGMGYYRRARLLHRAAREIERSHGGRVPGEASELLELPGLGRYTAGAVASICFGRAAPIVDGNVRRVLMRVEGRRGPQTGPEVERWAWAWAEELVGAAARLRPAAPGAFNEALMELGATVCVPKSPRCGDCPIRGLCVAFKKGLQDQIPPSKTRAGKKPLVCVSVLAEDQEGRLLVERRPERGLWARMWQAPTWEGEDEPGAGDLAAMIGGRSAGREVARFEHGTTHRDVRFIVRRMRVLGPGAAKKIGTSAPERCWLAPDAIGALALSKPQRRILLDIGAGAGGVP